MIATSLLVWASMGTTALGAAEKSFSATVAPEPLVAGATYGTVDRSGIVLTITNTSTQASLGSANVTVPPGLTLTGAAVVPGTVTTSGDQIRLRDLDLARNESAVVTIGARVECGPNHASYTWGFLTKQANDFNGTPGNDLVQSAPVTSTIDGTCGLTFQGAPASSEKAPVAITSEIYDPAGDAVTVSIVDAEGELPVAWWSGSISLRIGTNPGGASLSGTVSGSTTTGSVEFAPQVDKSATGYTLVATAVGAVGTPSAGTTSIGLASNLFNIVDDATICLDAVSTCLVTASGPNRGQGVKTRATVTASTGGQSGDLVILSVDDPATEFDCTGYTETTDVIFFNVTLPDGTTAVATRTKTTQMTLLAPYVTKSAAKYEACYKADMPFKTASGATATVGLLPTCAKQNPVAPCVVSRSTNKAKDVILTILSPAGDPGLKF